jgi:hypothetical protein
MKEFDFDAWRDQKKPIKLILDDVWVQSVESRNVEHRILSVGPGEYVTIPSQKYCTATISVSDGIMSHNYTVQAVRLLEDSMGEEKIETQTEMNMAAYARYNKQKVRLEKMVDKFVGAIREDGMKCFGDEGAKICEDYIHKLKMAHTILLGFAQFDGDFAALENHGGSIVPCVSAAHMEEVLGHWEKHLEKLYDRMYGRRNRE